MKNCAVILSVLLSGIAPITAQNIQRDSLWQAYRQAPNDSLRWIELFNLSQLYGSHNIDSALLYAQQSLEFAERHDPRLSPRSLNNVGLQHMNRGDFDQATEYYLRAIEAGKRYGCRICLAITTGNLGIISWNKKELNQAESYFRSAIDQSRELGDSTGLARYTNNLGLVLLDKKQLPEAEQAFREVLVLMDATGKQALRPIVYSNLGNVAYARADYPAAYDLYQQAYHQAEAVRDAQTVFLGLVNSGWAQLAMKNYDEAIRYFHLGLGKARAYGNEKYAEQALSSLAEGYKAKDDFQNAFHYLEKYLFLHDSLAARANDKAVMELETRFRTQEKEAQLARQQLEIAEQSGQKWLFAAVALLFLLVGGGLLQYFRQRQKIRQKEASLALQLKQAETEKLLELDRLKSSFFTNISHEFRTPLTLILGPAKQWLSAAGGGDKATVPLRDLRTLHRNGERLLTLVNQMLDLARIEAGRMRLHLAEGDVANALRVIGHSFESMAVQKNIGFRVEIPPGPPAGWFDADKIEKIAANLLSNAIRHTPGGGEVVFQAEFPGGRELHLQVTDTGSGIPAAEIDRIFDRFYQVEGSTASGSGIGLALVRELVQLHHGTVAVSSAPGAGSTFRVVLPLERSAFAPEEWSNAPPAAAPARIFPEAGPPPAAEHGGNAGDNSHLPVCLVVEDNADVRDYIRQQLQGAFRVLTAPDGLEGLERAREDMPDLVVSDIMMPGLDGTELCARLKTDERTSHIPVILLTAKADPASRIGGLETGADDYLTKPFDASELLARAQNLVRQRQMLRERFSRELFLQPKAVALTSADERFMQRVMEIVEAHLGDERFGVEELARQAGMSRSQLHRKVTALVDQSPVELIRNFRLRRAKEMLEAGTGSVSEICYEVGFNSPAYFSKSFKDAFGISPSEVRV
jgi:signal transduction histidine kinase/DNA-binding response OmpR family regulator/Tfp pilus assembly protein PilF